MTYVLDTHPIVWFLEGSGRLRAQAGTIITGSEPSVYAADDCLGRNNVPL
jgi:hypothetical protein